MSEPAKHRWRILFDALVLKKSEPNKFSVRRFNAFGLFSISRSTADSGGDDAGLWFVYKSSNFPYLNLHVRHVETRVALEKLQGFNNTGNVCVWPSEEVLAYYCAKHASMFEGKRICELGGGMTSLAGVVLALTCQAKEILLTDGNELSLQNIGHIIRKNSSSFKTSHVQSRLLRWEIDSDFEDIKGSFDFVIAADCFFFESLHGQLLNVIFQLLRQGGRAVMMAPRRQDTFHKFLQLSQVVMDSKMFENFDDVVWEIHTKKKKKGKEYYDENIHYPLMLSVEKRIIQI